MRSYPASDNRFHMRGSYSYSARESCVMAILEAGTRVVGSIRHSRQKSCLNTRQNSSV